MRARGFVVGAQWFRLPFGCVVGLLTVLSLSGRSQADSSLVDSLSFMSSPVAAVTGHAKQGRIPTDSVKGKSRAVTLSNLWLGIDGGQFAAAAVRDVVVLSDWDAVGHYEKVPLTVLSQLLIVSDFDDGRGASSMSLARMKNDFRSGDICSDLKNATCTMRGGFVSFYENTSPLPEPGTLLLVGSGVLASSLPVFRGWRARCLGGKHARVSI
jgi:hypothetical protein